MASSGYNFALPCMDIAGRGFFNGSETIGEHEMYNDKRDGIDEVIELLRKAIEKLEKA